MSWPDNEPSDFRSAAVAASEAMLRGFPRDASPGRRPPSYCLPRSPDLSHVRLPIKVLLVVCIVLAFSGVGIGVLLCILAKANVVVHARWPVPVGAGCVACGIGLLYFPMFVLRRVVRRHLSRPDPPVGFDGVSGGFFVSVENAATYNRFKILADDTGLLYVDFNSRYATIDGLCHTFGIRSEDVERLELHPNGRSVFLSYLIDQVHLDLVVVAWSLQSDTGRQTLGDLGGLFRRLQKALCPGEENGREKERDRRLAAEQAGIGQHTLYAYSEGNDLDDVADRLDAAFADLIAQGGWVCGQPRAVNQRHDDDPSLSPDDLPDWEIGLNLPLPDSGAEPPGWFADVERIVAALERVHSETGRDFVLGIGHKGGSFGEDLAFIGERPVDRARLRRAFGVLDRQ